MSTHQAVDLVVDFEKVDLPSSWVPGKLPRICKADFLSPFIRWSNDHGIEIQAFPHQVGVCSIIIIILGAVGVLDWNIECQPS